MRDFFVALSLANLLFLRDWEKARSNNYLDDFKPDLVATTLLVLATCAVLLIGWRLIRSSTRLAFAGKVLFLLLILIPLNALRLYYQQEIMALYGHRYNLVAWIVLALLAAPLVYALVTRRLRLRFLVRYGIVLTLALAPFTLFTFGGVIRDSYRRTNSATKPFIAHASSSTNSSGGTDEAQSQVKRQRVVWIIFDELEERTAFTDRPESVSMPELDRFRRESFVAGAAYPPAYQTIQSVPALLNGKGVTSIVARGDALVIWQKGETAPVVWKPQMTVFAEAADAGKKTGLVGVFLPYCATHGSVIDECHDFRTARVNEGLLKKTGRAFTIALDAVPFAFRLFLHRSVFENEIERYQSTIQQASILAADPKLDLVYLHFPLPHPPGIYDRVSVRLAISQRHSYLDNLELTDASFGIVRRAMEQAGLWQGSTVIVSADHWWRTDEVWKTAAGWTAEEQRVISGREPDHRIPFIVKLAGSERPMVYERPFNTLITRRLLMAVLNGRLSTTRDLVQLLESSAE